MYIYRYYKNVQILRSPMTICLVCAKGADGQDMFDCIFFNFNFGIEPKSDYMHQAPIVHQWLDRWMDEQTCLILRSSSRKNQWGFQ